jgi:hypothetical protein
VPGGGSWSLGGTSFGAVLCQEAGAGAQGAHDGFGAVMCHETGVETMGHMTVLELPWGLVARACALVSSFVWTWSLYAGVSDLQGTDSGPRAHLGRGCEPAGGASIISCAAFLSFIR